MKKIIYSTIVLTCFSLSIILFQLSCQKDAVSKSATGQTQSKFLYTIYAGGAPSGQLQYWTANLDGTNPQQIPIPLPSGLRLVGNGILTADGQTLIFSVSNTAVNVTYIYSISVTGTNLKKLYENLSEFEESEILTIF